MEKWEGGVESHVLYARVKLTPLFARLRSTGVRLRLRRSSCVASERTVSMTTMRMFGRFTQGWAVGRAGAAGGGTGRATGPAAGASAGRGRGGGGGRGYGDCRRCFYGAASRRFGIRRRKGCCRFIRARGEKKDREKWTGAAQNGQSVCSLATKTEQKRFRLLKGIVQARMRQDEPRSPRSPLRCSVDGRIERCCGDGAGRRSSSSHAPPPPLPPRCCRCGAGRCASRWWATSATARARWRRGS